MKQAFYLTPEELEVFEGYSKMTLPRHTSYPAAPFWKEGFSQADFSSLAAEFRETSRDLSLYVHVPYCRSLCYYCGCTKEIYSDERVAKRDPKESFLRSLKQEIDLRRLDFPGAKLRQLHFGGGTPTFLTPAQLGELISYIKECFPILPEAELAIEVDPRVTSDLDLEVLAEHGFNRISLGVQDFDEKVQQAVNRVQSYEMVERMLKRCRELGLQVNFDLIYGLPYQSQASMTETLDKVLALGPDRIAFFRLAMIPEMFKWQKSFTKAQMPSEAEALQLNLLGINKLLEGGYQFLGLDHFARNDDSLAVAAANGSLRRNFQGMSTAAELEILGIGPSAISQFAGGYFQNERDDRKWQEKLASGEPLWAKGLILSEDDLRRRWVVEKLYCYGELSKAKFTAAHGKDFDSYFAAELRSLNKLEALALVEVGEDKIRLSPRLGRLLVRAVAAVFDSYLEPASRGFELGVSMPLRRAGSKLPTFSQL